MPSRRSRQIAFAAVCVGVMVGVAILIAYPRSTATSGPKADVMEGELQSLVQRDSCHPWHGQIKRILVTGYGSKHNSDRRGYLRIDGRHYLYATCKRGIRFHFEGTGACHTYYLKTDDDRWISWSGSTKWLRSGYYRKDAQPFLFAESHNTYQGRTVYKIQHKEGRHWWVSYTNAWSHDGAVRANYYRRNAMNVEIENAA